MPESKNLKYGKMKNARLNRFNLALHVNAKAKTILSVTKHARTNDFHPHCPGLISQ